MGSLDALEKRIMDESEEKAAAIRSDAEQRAAGIIASARADAERITQETLAKAEEEAAEIRSQAVKAAEAEMRLATAQAKAEAMEHLFAEALKELQSHQGDERVSLYAELVAAAAPSGEVELIVSDEDRAWLEAGALTQIADKVRADGRDLHLSLATETRPMTGGFIVKQGSVEINCSFEALVRFRREELEPLLARVLFGSE